MHDAYTPTHPSTHPPRARHAHHLCMEWCAVVSNRMCTHTHDAVLTLFILALALCAGRRQGVCCIQMAYRRLALASSEGQAVALHPAPWGSNVHSRGNVPRHLQLVRAKCHPNNLHIDCNIHNCNICNIRTNSTLYLP